MHFQPAQAVRAISVTIDIRGVCSIQYHRVKHDALQRSTRLAMKSHIQCAEIVVHDIFREVPRSQRNELAANHHFVDGTHVIVSNAGVS